MYARYGGMIASEARRTIYGFIIMEVQNFILYYYFIRTHALGQQLQLPLFFNVEITSPFLMTRVNKMGSVP